MESIKRNYFFQVCYQILNMALPFATSPYIARVLGAENLGIYSYTCSIANLFVLFINLGIEKYGTRLIATNKDDEYKLDLLFSQLLFLKVFLGLAVLAVYFIVVFLFFEYHLLFVLQSLLLLSSILDINWFYFGLEQFKITVIRNFCFKLITVALVFILVKDENDLAKYCLIMSLGTAISQAAVWTLLGKYVHIKKVNIGDVIVHFKPVLVLFIAILAQSAYTYVDKIMIGTLSDMVQLGYCENAYKVISFPMGVITSFSAVMLPRMSLLFKNDYALAEEYLDKSMHVIAILSIGMSAGMFLVGENFSILFWGDEFLSSGKIIKIISPIVVFMAIADCLRNQLLIPRNRDKEYIVAVVLGAFTNILCNFLLIPRYKAFGAAIGSVISYFVILLYQATVTRRELSYYHYIKKELPFAIISIFMVLCVQKLERYVFINISWISLIIEILIGVLIYGGLTLVWLIITHDSLLNIFKNKIKFRIR